MSLNGNVDRRIRRNNLDLRMTQNVAIERAATWDSNTAVPSGKLGVEVFGSNCSKRMVV